MRTHIKVVGIVNIVLGALGVIGSIVGVLFGTVGSFGALFGGQVFGAVAGVVGTVVFGIIFGCLAFVRMTAGFGILKGAQWARFTIILISALSLLSFPIGTVFGIYSLWVLLNADGQREFSTPTI